MDKGDLFQNAKSAAHDSYIMALCVDFHECSGPVHAGEAIESANLHVSGVRSAS